MATLTFATEFRGQTISEYKDGRYFHTNSTITVNAPMEQVAEALNDLLNGLKKSPTKDLKWAFDGLSKSKSVDDNVKLFEKNVTYDKATSDYSITMLMITDNKSEYEFKIEGELKNVTYNTGRREVCLHVTKKVKVLSDGLISITAVPKDDNTTILMLHSKLKFGFIIDMFFTQKRYKEIIEWRLAGFLSNIKKRAEAKKINS